MEKDAGKKTDRSIAAGAGGAGSSRGRAGAGHSRPPLARMLRLHEWLVANRYPNCRKVAAELEVSAKTVQRDLNFMRDQMGLPIEYDKMAFGYRYARPVTGFPAMGIILRKPKVTPWRRLPPAKPGEFLPLTQSTGSGDAARIRFDAERARALRTRTWHPTQIIFPMPDGTAELALRVRDEFELARWVLSWAGHARVLEPGSLRDRVREMAMEIAGQHA